jgi:hypothetical protein
LIALLDKLEGEEHLLFRLVAQGESFKVIGKTFGISQQGALSRWFRLKEKIRNAGR